jgi:hypothetical protein
VLLREADARTGLNWVAEGEGDLKILAPARCLGDQYTEFFGDIKPKGARRGTKKEVVPGVSLIIYG